MHKNESDEQRIGLMTDKEIISRLLKYAKPFILPFSITFFLMLIAVGLSLLGPWLIGKSFDVLFKDEIIFNNILVYISIYLIAILVGSFITFKQTILLQKTGQKIIYNIRKDLFKHIEYLSIETIHDIPVGTLVTRVSNDTNTLNEMYTSVLVNSFKNIFTIIGVIIAMFLLEWKITLLVLIIVPVILICSIIFRTFSRKTYRAVRKNLASINAFLSEHISGMKIIQIFNQEVKKYNQFEKKNNKLLGSYIREIIIFAIYRPTMYFLYIAAIIIVIWVGGIGVIEGTISASIIISFQLYIRLFFDPIQQLAEQFNILQAGFASSERIFTLLDKEKVVKDSQDAIELEDLKGEIEFKNVWFAYEGKDWILKNVSFKVKAKETVAFVGATGAGKTTILGLITRNYDIQKGQILIDGNDINNIKISSLRSYIGQMLQDVFMFSGTIESNIKLRDELITHDEVVKACKYVNADKFIEKLPDRYNEEIRERGNNLSAGQRQLISFARTIVFKPRVMILDEATANIDTETEQLIQESLLKMMNIGTMLIVAHRLSTIRHVSRIVVLSKGEIIEQGTHQELLKNRGHYYNLYKLQYQEKNDTN